MKLHIKTFKIIVKIAQRQEVQDPDPALVA
jgi:hypothetical protein